MPDRRTHRGAHPADAKLFAPSVRQELVRAVDHLSWLLSRGYADKSSLKLVGDRFQLTQRQRIAVMRSACSDDALQLRSDKRVTPAQLGGRTILVDGYNVLTTIESALAGAVILRGRDGCCRDIAGVHGTFRKVAETVPAIDLVGRLLHEHRVTHCLWLLDRPVSNSGRLKLLIEQKARQGAWPWDVQVVYNPDAVLAESQDIIATSDSEVLNRCRLWCDLAAGVIARHVTDANVVELGG